MNVKKELTNRIVSMALAALILVMASINPVLANDYYEDLNTQYFFGNNLYYNHDYAMDTVTEYGGWDEGEPIPTDFEATTFVEEIVMHKHHKAAVVEANFYDSSLCWDGYGTDTAWVAYATSESDKDSDYAIVYAEGIVNEEYGFCFVTSQHKILCHAWENNHWVDWQLTQTIYIDTTGLCK
jgi:hypothetical protein